MYRNGKRSGKFHFKREYLNRQARSSMPTKKFKAEHIVENENNSLEDKNDEKILEIQEKISNAYTNLSKSDWLLTYDLRLKDIRKIKTTKNAVEFFKKWALFKNSSVYVVWDFQKLLEGSFENSLTQQWEKFYIASSKYVFENIKDKKTKIGLSKLMDDIDDDVASQFTGNILDVDN